MRLKVDVSLLIFQLVCLHTVAVCLCLTVYIHWSVCIPWWSVCLFVYDHWSVCTLWRSVYLCMSTGLFAYCGSLSVCLTVYDHWSVCILWLSVSPCMFVGLFAYCGSLSLFDCVCLLVCSHTVAVCLSVVNLN